MQRTMLATTVRIANSLGGKRGGGDREVYRRYTLNDQRIGKKYGFKATTIEVDKQVPGPVWELIGQSVERELRGSRYRRRSPLQRAMSKTTLDVRTLWEREERDQSVEAPRWMMLLYYVICHGLDRLYEEEPIQRFWFLETIARMPYFSYVTVYHMYETFGVWEINSSAKLLHIVEELNECHHLRVMELLGGGRRWRDRFLARHVALVYYLTLLLLFMVSPKEAYLTSELLESHAVFTYKQFLEENEALLKGIQAPAECKGYYEENQLYRDSILSNPRDPNTLYDVFWNILHDEECHSDVMRVMRGGI